LTEKRKINAICSQNLKSILSLLLVWKQGSFKVQRENPSGKKLTSQRQIDGLEDGVKQCMQVVKEIDWNQRSISEEL
jgi:hypothetical protein